MNKCGVTFDDCSCDIDCKRNGTCCSDYKHCDFIEEKNKEMKINRQVCKVENCSNCMIRKNKEICLMCNEGFFYYRNNCLSKCPNNTIELDNNNICIDKISCKVNNCEKCQHKVKCEKCIHGLFLYENQCLEKCPIGTRANRIDFTCQDKSSNYLI